MRRRTARGRQRSNGIPTGSNGSGSSPRSHIGGTQAPASALTAGMPATLLARRAASAPPVTTARAPISRR